MRAVCNAFIAGLLEVDLAGAKAGADSLAVFAGARLEVLVGAVTGQIFSVAAKVTFVRIGILRARLGASKPTLAG